MGKTTGFMEYERIEEGYKPVPERLKHYKEFVIGLDESQAKVQGARCMDCGTPFCNSGCPVNNIIPDFNDLVFQGDWRNAIYSGRRSLCVPRYGDAELGLRGGERSSAGKDGGTPERRRPA